jgi:ABC-2 type transport system ATP-binding protein
MTVRPMDAAAAAADADGMIAVDHLTKRYGSQLAVDDISFRCEPGTVTGFLGPNGAGKSTTLRMICGLTPPTAGSATVLGTAYRDLDNPGRRVGVLLDASAQHAGRTGREVLILSAQVLGVPRSRVDELLERVGLSHRAHAFPEEMSGGQQQRVAIARALVMKPKVMLFDEPTSALDAELVGEVLDVMESVAREGMTMVVVTHELRFARRIADSLVMMDEGRVIEEADPDALFDNPEQERTRRFLAAVHA